MATPVKRTAIERLFWAIVWSVFWATAAVAIASRLAGGRAAEPASGAHDPARSGAVGRVDFAALPLA